MLELLAPAGSPESVLAAVQNGADAVYMGLGNFNARRGAKNFAPDEFDQALRYCHERGCKVYVTMNTLISDREMKEAAQLAGMISDMGADAILVQDLGLLSVLRRYVPDMPLHASTQMSIHSLAGVEAAAKLGLTRAVLARELPFEQIKYIAKNAPIETEIFVHGALCFCYSGQCYMSSVIGGRSGNRGMCAQPCRMEYSMGGRMEDSHPLSLKDNCLVSRLQEIEDAGVACVKIEGRMKRPEYTGIVTGVYSSVIREHRLPTEKEMNALEEAFSRQGFTTGYFDGDKADMFGIRGEVTHETEKLYAAARRGYADNEISRVPVKLGCIVKHGQPIMAVAVDRDGHRAEASGRMPDNALNTAVTSRQISAQLSKTGGTPYYCEDVYSDVEDQLYVPKSDVNELRRVLLAELSRQRTTPPIRRRLEIPALPRGEKPSEKPYYIYQVLKASQLTPALAKLNPAYVYVPLTEMHAHFEALMPFIENGTTPVVVLPRVITDGETKRVEKMLSELYALGIREALVGNLGHVMLAHRAGMNLRGDFGLNIYNSYSLEMLKLLGMLSATASFEMHMSQVRDMSKCLDTELIAYGRLPLMVSEQCVISRSSGRCNCDTQQYLKDRRGALLPVVREFDHRNVIYNAHRLYLADRLRDVSNAGIRGLRLLFTTESAHECTEIARRYLSGEPSDELDLTRGLYYRGVEKK